MRIDCIVLAAGAARRFGGEKLLAPFKSGCLLEAALYSAFGAEGCVHLVLPPDADDLRNVALAWAENAGRGDDLVVVVAHDCEEGLAASLHAGVRSAGEAQGVVIFLGDMPAIPRRAGARVKLALAGGALAAAISLKGRRGHPVGFSSLLFPNLLAMTGDQGAAPVLAEFSNDIVLIDLHDPGIFLDVDTEEDLVRAREVVS